MYIFIFSVKLKSVKITSSLYLYQLHMFMHIFLNPAPPQKKIEISKIEKNVIQIY